MTTALNCIDLHSGYGAGNVLDGVSVRIETGEIYALIGKNGAGKTTLVHTILGILKPTSGTIEIFGSIANGVPTNEIISIGVACAPQEKAFFNDLTVDENLRLGSLFLAKKSYGRERERVVDMFPFMAGRMKQKAGTLSGGEQAMLKVARVLLSKPKIVLLDEVTEGLQPSVVDRVRAVLMRDHLERGTTIVVVEQNLQFVVGLASRYGLMERGQIHREGALSDEDSGALIVKHLSV